MTYALPFVGLPISLALPLITHGSRRYLWSSVSPRTSLICSILAWTGLWLPGLADFLTPLFYLAHIEISTTWLILPLCGPANLAATTLPALAATAVCTIGLLTSAVNRRPWPWVVAAWLAPWTHQTVFLLIPHEIIC